MLMTWSSRERNRSCSPLSRRSRGRIEPSANHVRGQRITAGDSRESPTSICKKIDPGAPISGKSNRWNSCNFYCPSIASGYFTDDDVETNNIGGFGRKVRVVALTPGLASREVNLVAAQEPPDILDVNIAQRLGQQRAGPARKPLRGRLVQQLQYPLVGGLRIDRLLAGPRFV